MGKRLGRSGFLFAWRRIVVATFMLAALSLVMPVSANAAETLKGVALVIGNGEYEHLSKLANPEQDANGVEELLDKLGFDTTAATDRDARRLKRDLEGFAEDAEGADVAVLYYSGHGIEAGGQNYLVPVDADLSSLDDAGETLVAVDALIEKLKAEVPVVIVMLDACRDNPFPPDAVLKLTPDGPAEPIAVSGLGGSRSAVSLNPTATAAPAPDANLGTVLAFAAEPGKVALDGQPGGNSPYAAAVLRHLSAMSGDEFGMVMRMVAEEVYLKTGGQQRPWVNESMRRLLYLGKAPDQPTGAEGDILNERRGLLVTIAALPDSQRRAIETVATDAGVPMDALYGMLKALGADVPQDDKQLETLLRGQTEKVKAMIAERDTLKSADPEIQRLSNLADTALAEGALNTAISLRQQAKERAREVEATVEDAEAQLKQRRIELAEVYAKSAEAYALAFKHREAALDYEEAAKQVDRWDDEKAFWYTRSAATAWLEAGKLRGGASDLEHAVTQGKAAATMADRLLAENGVTREYNEDYWQDISAQTLNNLANASSSLYFATKDRQYLSESIDAYERALKVLSRERVPLDWVVVQFNLAGNLMMMGENDNDEKSLEKAIEAQEAALTVWTRQDHPERWGMTTAELARTKAILGTMKKSKPILDESILAFNSALEVLTEADTPNDWAVAQDGLANAYSQRAFLTKDEADTRKSIAASQEALKVYTLEKAPRPWARTMHDMAVHIIGNTKGEARRVALDKALAIYDQITAALHPDEQLNEYGLSTGNAALTRIDIGVQDKNEAMVEKAVAALRDLAGVYRRNQRPREAGNYTQEVGEALARLGKLRARPDEFQQAIDAYGEAANIFREAGDEKSIEAIKPKLASAYGDLGFHKFNLKDFAGVVAARRAALANSDREKYPEDWRFAVVQLGVALKALGETEKGVETLREAARNFREVIAATDVKEPPEELPKNLQSLVNIQTLIAERTSLPADYAALADTYASQAAGYQKAEREGARDDHDAALANQGWALSVAGDIGKDPAAMEKASAIYRDLLDRQLSDGNRLFATLELIRARYILGNLNKDSVAHREVITLTDEHWPVIDRLGSPRQKSNALLDKANLMWTLAAANPSAYAAPDIAATYKRAIALIDAKKEPELWQSAQRQFVNYELDGADRPDFSRERMQSGLGALKSLLESTPRDQDPQNWAGLANWYGYTLGLQGKRESRLASFSEAVPILRDALSAYRTGNDALSVAHTQDSLCSALVGLGRIEKKRDLVAEGVENCDRSVAYMRENQKTDVLPIAEANLADARKALAELGTP